MLQTKKIFFSPLDWGLGHTTRCMPIVEYLLSQNHLVYIGAEGVSAQLYKDKFPQVTILPLEGYHIRYGIKKAMGAIIKQVPHILSCIQKEHSALVAYQEQYHFDFIISDNRYGLWHKSVPCAIMTHQLNMITGMGSMADAVTRKLHYIRLQKFNQIWVVDQMGMPNMSGKLAHPLSLPKNTAYLGNLSQFNNSKSTAYRSDNYILVLLSGPEPLRSQLEHILYNQATIEAIYNFVFVSGSNEARLDSTDNITFIPIATAQQLADLIQYSSGIICRSGYSTLMDLAQLNKKAVLIPTPGQSEQVYLAKYFEENYNFLSFNQDNFILKEAMKWFQTVDQNWEPSIIVNSGFKRIMDIFIGK